MSMFEKIVAMSRSQVPAALQAEFAVLLKRLLVALMISGVVFLVNVFVTGRWGLRNMIPATMIVLALIAYADWRAGRINRGLLIIIWGLWLSFCSFGFFVAGLRTPALLGLPVLLMMAAWVHGMRPALWMAGATVSILGVMTVAEYQNWLPPPLTRTPFDLLLTLTIAVVITTIVAVTLAANFYRHFAAEQKLAAELRRHVADLDASQTALRELNEMLEERVSERTEEYTAANNSLREAMDRLEQTRAELVQAEKLASLGAMVAGVSHELGTPLGNALLVATTLQHNLEEIDAGVTAGRLTDNDVRKSIVQAGEASRLMSRNVERAIGLVRSFKQTAIDQASQQRRSFDLATVVEDTIASLRPLYKLEPWKIVIDIAPAIQLDSYPGPLEQIIINLVANSVSHGFDGRDRGTVTIGGRLEKNEYGRTQVVMTFSDDGNGISPENLARIFDPFFTTKLGKGGSGVGLNIVYRIATTVLGGSIVVRSVPAQGTTFTLKIPPQAPQAD